MILEDKITKIDDLKTKIEHFGKIPDEILKKINYKFRLEWNYHSNKMEGGTLTKDETRHVMIGVIDVQGKPLKDVFEMSGHDNMVLEVLKMAKGEINISEKRILALHKAIMYEENTENKNKIGKWKTENNTIETYKNEDIDFLPASEVKNAMHDLINWLNAEIDKIKNNQKNTKNKPLHTALLAFEFHFRYESIHPFYDGNGRTGRILMNIILVAFGYPPIIIKADKRDVYFRFLADVRSYGGDKNLYFSFMSDLLCESLELVNDVIQGKNIDEEDDLDKKLNLLKISLQTQEEASKRTKEIVENLVTNLTKDNSFVKEIERVVNKFQDFFINVFIEHHSVDDIEMLSIVDYNQEIDHFSNKNYSLEETLYGVDFYPNLSYLYFKLEGFKKAGMNVFDVDIRIDFAFEEYFYTISFKDKNNIIKKLYHQLPATSEIENFVKIIGNAIYEEIEQKLNQGDKQ